MLIFSVHKSLIKVLSKRGPRGNNLGLLRAHEYVKNYNDNMTNREAATS
jgi:hypothetical protein